MVRCRRGLRPACVMVLWLLTCVNEFDALKIVKLIVPDVIQYGAQDTALLDCDYTYGNDTQGMVLKWFFQSRMRPVYQWIAGHMPQAINVLRGRVDLTYRASEDPFKMYRAIKIVKMSTELSGEYTCVISTFMAEDDATKRMVVFAPETSFRLIQNKSDDDTVNVICAADGAFPAPILTLSTPERRLDDVSHSAELVGDRYSAVAKVTLRDEILPSPAEFVCTLRIPSANYVVRKEAIYYPGPISTTPEIVTAVDMQLAAAVGSSGTSLCLLTWALQLMLAQILLV
ncbi:uncharacterized protein LOC121728982 [Aricia agestis]|uniref:uncharacterized protein LOC121728982 n=1 Tax=Aricia agestis TaxID=91739 RepID=UPI001C203977|nr:uncharacterized protein LOC121728982 [Aricia agestis]